MIPEIIAIEIQNMRIEIPCREELLQTLARVVGDTPTAATVSTVPVPTPGKTPAPQTVPTANPTSAAPGYTPPTEQPSAPLSAPTMPAPTPSPAVVPTAAPPTYTRDQLAAVPIMDAGRLTDLQAALAKYGVQVVDQLPNEALGAFAADLRLMGAQI